MSSNYRIKEDIKLAGNSVFMVQYRLFKTWNYVCEPNDREERFFTSDTLEEAQNFVAELINKYNRTTTKETIYHEIE